MAETDIIENKRLANSYAGALYEIATQRNQVYIIKEQLGELCRLLDDEPDLMTIFSVPSITKEQRQMFVDQISRELDQTIVAFLGVLNTRNRLWLIPEIAKSFGDIDDVRNNRLKTKLYTSDEVDKFLMEEIETVLQKFFNKELIIEHRIDPQILGGFIVRAGDLMIDASVRSRLQQIKTDLLRRGKDEIQSGRNFVGN